MQCLRTDNKHNPQISNEKLTNLINIKINWKTGLKKTAES